MTVLSNRSARTTANIEGAEVLLTKNQRLLGKDDINIREKAAEGLSRKFHLIYFADDETNKQEDKGYARLVNTYDVECHLDELKRRLF